MQYGENGRTAVHKMSQNRQVAFLNFDMDLALRVCQVSHKPTECTHVWFAGTCSSLVTLYENSSMVAATD